MLEPGDKMESLPNKPLNRESVKNLTRHDKIGVAVPAILRENNEVTDLVISGHDWVYGVELTSEGWIVRYARTGEKVEPNGAVFQEAMDSLSST